MHLFGSSLCILNNRSCCFVLCDTIFYCSPSPIGLGLLNGAVQQKMADNNICLFLFYICYHVGALLVPNIWLKHMSKLSGSDQKSHVTLGVYGGAAATSIFLEAIGIIFLFLAFLESSEQLHDQMTTATIMSPVLFFDTNPVGRIMNRFSKDIGAIDDFLPLKFVYSMTCLLYCFGVLVLTGIVNYWFVLVIIPTLMLFIIICRHYLKTSRELSRLAAIRCSPLYAHLSETIDGIEVIHSTQMEETNLRKLYK